MIDGACVRLLARYNRWQNQNIVGTAATLADAERPRDRGALFGSIHGTLSHLVWADGVWTSRLVPDAPRPPGGVAESATLYPDWDDLVARRAALDARLVAFADAIDDAWLTGDLVWFSGASGRELRQPRWRTILHVFNHQTHHRGQVHAMLTQAGARPGDTDLMLMPE